MMTVSTTTSAGLARSRTTRSCACSSVYRTATRLVGASVATIVGTITDGTPSASASSFPVSSAFPPPAATTISGAHARVAATSASTAASVHSPGNGSSRQAIPSAAQLAESKGSTCARTTGSTTPTARFPSRARCGPMAPRAPGPCTYVPAAAKMLKSVSLIGLLLRCVQVLMDDDARFAHTGRAITGRVGLAVRAEAYHNRPPR